MLMQPYLSKNGKVVDYDDINCLHYSTLKLLSQNVRAFKERIDEELDNENEATVARTKKHFLVGECVDVLFTNYDSFDQKYIVFEGKEAGDKASAVLHTMLIDSINLETIDADELKNICHFNNFYTNWKDGEAHRRELLKHKDYYNFLLAAQGKTVLDLNTHTTIQNTFNRINSGRYTNPFLMDLFNNYEVYPQYCSFGLVLGTPYKGRLDLFAINHVSKTIRIVDIKTMWKHTKNFTKDYDNFRYGLQAVGYVELIKQEYPDYQIEYFFIVESTNAKLSSPVIYQISENMLYEEMYGNESKRKVGFSELIDTYNYHDVTQEWEYERNVVENKGVLIL